MRPCFFFGWSTSFRLSVGYEFIHSSGSLVFRDYVAACSSPMDLNNNVADRWIVLAVVLNNILKCDLFP